MRVGELYRFKPMYAVSADLFKEPLQNYYQITTSKFLDLYLRKVLICDDVVLVLDETWALDESRWIKVVVAGTGTVGWTRWLGDENWDLLIP